MSTFTAGQALPVPNIVNRNAAGAREDFLSTPTTTRVYKNGVLQVGESATVTQVIGETGEYAVGYAPTGTAPGDDWYVAVDITRADASTDTVSSPVCRVASPVATDTASREASKADVSGITSAGSGIHTVTVTVTDGTDPIPSASLRVALNGVANGEYPAATDAAGVAVIPTNAGVVTVYASAPGFATTTGTKAVTGDDTLAVVMTANATPTAGDHQSVGTLETINADGSQSPNTKIYLRPAKINAHDDGGALRAIADNTVVAVSDGDGVVSIALARGVDYVVSSSTSKGFVGAVVSIPDEATFTARRVTV